MVYKGIDKIEPKSTELENMFRDRKDAGEKLAQALEKYRDKDTLVLAIPRGGVEVGYLVAEYLHANFSIIISRKLPFPDNPESGFGAIAEDGSTFIFADTKYWIPKPTINRVIEEQREEIKRRIAVLREGRPLPEVLNQVVILVDDGVARGATMKAAVMLLKNKKAKKIIVAAPVSGNEFVEEMSQEVDEVVILERPRFFQAVAQVYYNWYDVPDKEVIEMMKNWQDK
jgi:predicted phosphoribosyltransferase